MTGPSDASDVWLETEHDIVSRGSESTGAAYASTGLQALRVAPTGRYAPFGWKPYVYGASRVARRPVSRNA